MQRAHYYVISCFVLVGAQIQLVQPGQIQLQGGQTLQLQGQQGQAQQIIIQQPQTAITAGQNQVSRPLLLHKVWLNDLMLCKEASVDRLKCVFHVCDRASR